MGCTVDNLQRLVGMLEIEAIGLLAADKLLWKVVKRDGKVLPSSMTMEYVPGMVYLFVDHGVVTRIGVNK